MPYQLEPVLLDLTKGVMNGTFLIFPSHLVYVNITHCGNPARWVTCRSPISTSFSLIKPKRHVYFKQKDRYQTEQNAWEEYPYVSLWPELKPSRYSSGYSSGYSSVSRLPVSPPVNHERLDWSLKTAIGFSTCCSGAAHPNWWPRQCGHWRHLEEMDGIYPVYHISPPPGEMCRSRGCHTLFLLRKNTGSIFWYS